MNILIKDCFKALDSLQQHHKKIYQQLSLGLIIIFSGSLPLAGQVNTFLKKTHGRMYPQVAWYTGTQLDSVHRLDQGILTNKTSEWSCTLKETSGTEKDVTDVTALFKLEKGNASSAAVSVAFDFSNWSIENYILVPAMIYGGNRFRILPVKYPPYIHNAEERPLDMPITTTDILHLNKDGSYAKIEMTTGNMATPMFSFFNPKNKTGLIILTNQQSRFGNNGISIEEQADGLTKHNKTSLVVSAPAVREKRYVMGNTAPSGDKAADWKAGDTVALQFKIFYFKADNLVAFYKRVFEERKALTGKNTFSNTTPYSVASNLILQHFDKDKWLENDSVAMYNNHPGSDNPYNYQIGWNGIPVITYPMLIDLTPERLRRVLLSFHHVYDKSQGKSGLFYAINMNGKIYGDPHGEMAERTTIAMPRRSMDVLYFGLQSFNLLKKAGYANSIRPEWEMALKRCADGLVNVWKKYGQFGQFIDVDNLKMDVNGSTAGCAAGAGLALASEYFHNPEYLKVAEEATDMYLKRDFMKGYAGGGAAEILQSPDSETPWDMSETCMELYAVTKNYQWVQKAEFVVNFLSTWMVSYDYKFPENSAMGKAGIHAAGSIFASSQNNHSAPGYYILPGDFMLKLFRATGNPLYAQMYKDQSHNVIQYVGAPYNPFKRETGTVTERVQLSDWEGHNEGHTDYHDSNMAWEVLAALTCQENPGIYLHTDDDTFLVLDHIEAGVIKRSAEGVLLELKNTTPYNATVSIFAESSKQAGEPLGNMNFTQWPKVNIDAGATIKVTVLNNGQIKQQ
jgi:hypothetical protein